MGMLLLTHPIPVDDGAVEVLGGADKEWLHPVGTADLQAHHCVEGVFAEIFHQDSESRNGLRGGKSFDGDGRRTHVATP